MLSSLRIVLAAVLVLTLAACTGDEPDVAPTVRGDEALTVGGGRTTEQLVLQSLYGELLGAAGYKVDYKAADSRDVYGAALATGEIDVVPEYAATAAEYWNQKANGTDADAVATSDATATVAAMKPVLLKEGLTVLTPSRAVDQAGFAVTQTFSTQKKVTTLSQLAALGQPVTVAGPAACAQQPFCGPGLKRVYGLTVGKVLPTGYATAKTKQSVVDGSATIGVVGTIDDTLAGLGLVLLQDDKKLQLADNVVPVLNTEAAGTAAVAKALNALAPVLTTDDLAGLVADVDIRAQQPLEAAHAYLVEKKLLAK